MSRYRYDGLYEVEEVEIKAGEDGHKVCVAHFRVCQFYMIYVRNADYLYPHTLFFTHSVSLDNLLYR